MNLILQMLANVALFVFGVLVVFNIFSIIGYATHHKNFVDRVQRRVVRVTSLLRLGVR